MQRIFLFIFYALLICFTVRRASADGFIIIHERVEVPSGHYAFAPLEVSYHHVNVRIDGQVATTSVDEEFYNPNNQRLEGTYLFPIPKGAAIDKFLMEIGGKEVEAELLPAAKARGIYEDIVRRMKDPALLEYSDRDVFKVRIYPIEPRSGKRIKISYTQVLRSDDGLVSYLYPLNTEKFSAAPVKNVSVKIELKTSENLRSIYSPSHDVEIHRKGDREATIGFEGSHVRPDTDLQLLYSTEKKDLAVNLMSYQTGSENGYFMLLASPGAGTKTKPIPKDVAFVVDTSGSMAGEKLRQAKKALHFCVENLNEEDRFEVIRFSTEAEPFFGKLTPAKPENRERASKFIEAMKPIGGTAISEALERAIALRPTDARRPYVVIFLTDGQPTVGNTSESAIVELAARGGKENTRIFSFGIGTDLNTHLLDKITEATHAVSEYVLPQEDIEVKVSRFFTKIKEPAMANLKIRFEGSVRTTKLHPSPLPDLFKGDQLILVGRYEGSGPSEAILEGTANGVAQTYRYKLDFAKEQTNRAFVPRLWATRRIGHLLDEIRFQGESSELREEVTELARQYGIVTPYTAYLIVEDEGQRNVPVASQSFNGLRSDASTRSFAAGAYEEMKTKKDGDFGVGNARAQNSFKNAARATDALKENNFETGRALSKAAAPSAQSSAKLVQYAQQSRYVNGRSFFQNGRQWIDSNVQKKSGAREVQVRFNSPEYFALLASHPEGNAWFALGANVKVLLANTIYEIME